MQGSAPGQEDSQALVTDRRPLLPTGRWYLSNELRLSPATWHCFTGRNER